MNRTYEIMFIVRPDVEEADLDKLIEGFSANITSGGGEVKSVEKMGRRRLAYTVRKFNDGFYVLFTVGAPGSLIGEIERRLRVSEPVIKFITVRMDEEEKRLAKVKALRDSKVKRSAQPKRPSRSRLQKLPLPPSQNQLPSSPSAQRSNRRRKRDNLRSDGCRLAANETTVAPTSKPGLHRGRSQTPPRVWSWFGTT
jgi:small subunit ribosomal protein S6